MSEEKQKIKILDIEYTIIDQIENISIPDSFVKVNKIGIGSGEARLYLGSQKNDFENFFGSYPAKCFLLKKDLGSYLVDARFEYEEQEQVYQKDISKFWQEYVNKLEEFSEMLNFEIESALGEKDGSRYYIRAVNTHSSDIFYGYFREIVLPVITYLSILKISDDKGNILFYFTPFLNYFFNPYYNPKKIDKIEKQIESNENLTREKKEQIVTARIGQGKYRSDLLERMSECLITKVNDERILIASHIKPWSVSEDSEKIDPSNGLILTPTYDRLFDQGFITFENDGTIRISPYISPLNIKKLNLIPNKKYILPNDSKRLEYLEFHRKNIFKE
jgi:predicted restriction endonuclease